MTPQEKAKELSRFPKVKYHHEMRIFSGHYMWVKWEYEDMDITEYLSDATVIFDYQQLLILAELL